MIIAVLSDIHGNITAFQSVLDKIFADKRIEGIVICGDLIDYGPNSNEVIRKLRDIKIPIICNIWGNHEHAIMENMYDRFSSRRGQNSAHYTKQQLTEESLTYIKNKMFKSGKESFFLNKKRCLAIHGNLKDAYWFGIHPDSDLQGYQEFDFVFSGHSHEPHCFEKYYQTENISTRNRKKTIFINPGSVGQPRNLNNRAQYAVVDIETEEVRLLKVEYDIDKQMGMSSDKIDVFYKNRIKLGV